MTASPLEVIPTVCKDTEHHRSKCEALIFHCVTFVQHTGDAGFAGRLWDALQLLPEVSAHEQNVFDANHLSTEVSIHVEMAEARQRMFRIFHKNPELVSMLQRMPRNG